MILLKQHAVDAREELVESLVHEQEEAPSMPPRRHRKQARSHGEDEPVPPYLQQIPSADDADPSTCTGCIGSRYTSRDARCCADAACRGAIGM